jgi:uncharacterized protein YhbP (UPF0306 family)
MIAPRGGFLTCLVRRRQRSAEVRHVKAEERAAQIKAYKQEHPEATVKEMVKLFQVSERTIWGLKLTRGSNCNL